MQKIGAFPLELVCCWLGLDPTPNEPCAGGVGGNKGGNTPSGEVGGPATARRAGWRAGEDDEATACCSEKSCA